MATSACAGCDAAPKIFLDWSPMKANSILAFGVLCACLQACNDSGNDAAPVLRLNELVAENTPPSGDAGHSPWVEVVNNGRSAIRLGDFVLKTDQDSWAMPDVLLEPGELYVLESLVSASASTGSFMAEGTREISLADADGRQLDRVRLSHLLAGESFARYPNGSGRFSIYPPERVTRGGANPDIGFVRKRASETAFRPRDSSPNAILNYDGYFWILGGWSNFAPNLWFSRTDVWRSKDAVDWELVNDSPPYIHYCSFVVWQGRMWALGPASFSSSDGIEWRPEPIQAARQSRSVIFNDMLVNIGGGGSAVRGTYDGRQWFVLNGSPPWGGNRVLLVAAVHAGKIWVVGGAADYGTPNQVVFNDVWSSGDGVDWELVTPNAAWAPRMWASLLPYDDKLFLFNGANYELWPEQYGNSAEIWFTSDGAEWFELKSESLWEARHASFSVLDGRSILLMAGYGHGGLSRMHNDVWDVNVSIFFSKPEGALHETGTWGKFPDGSGRSPRSFGGANQVFILRNRSTFTIDARLSITGAGSRIVVGDGRRENPVLLEISNNGRATHPLNLSSNSTTIAVGHPPAIHFRDAGALLYLQ